MNKGCFIGNVTADAVARVNSAGVDVCSFTVAINDIHAKNKEDAKPLFVRVNAWRQSAKTCGQYVKKGMKIYVEGELRDPQDTIYTTEKGETRCNLEIKSLTTFEFINKNSDNSDRGYTRDEFPHDEPTAVPQSNGGYTEVDTDELPF